MFSIETPKNKLLDRIMVIQKQSRKGHPDISESLDFIYINYNCIYCL